MEWQKRCVGTNMLTIKKPDCSTILHYCSSVGNSWTLDKIFPQVERLKLGGTFSPEWRERGAPDNTRFQPKCVLKMHKILTFLLPPIRAETGWSILIGWGPMGDWHWVLLCCIMKLSTFVHKTSLPHNTYFDGIKRLSRHNAAHAAKTTGQEIR